MTQREPLLAALLRRAGYPIVSRMVTLESGKRVAEYELREYLALPSGAELRVICP